MPGDLAVFGVKIATDTSGEKEFLRASDAMGSKAEATDKRITASHSRTAVAIRRTGIEAGKLSGGFNVLNTATARNSQAVLMAARNLGPLTAGSLRLAEGIGRATLRFEGIIDRTRAAAAAQSALTNAHSTGLIAANSLAAAQTKLASAANAVISAESKVERAFQASTAAAREAKAIAGEIANQRNVVRVATQQATGLTKTAATGGNTSDTWKLQDQAAAATRVAAREQRILNELLRTAGPINEQTRRASEGLKVAQLAQAAAAREAGEAHKLVNIAQSGAGAGMLAMTATVGAVVAALAVLGTAIYGIKKAWDFAMSGIQEAREFEKLSFGIKSLIGNAEIAQGKIAELEKVGTLFGDKDVMSAAQQLLVMGTGLDNLLPRINAFANLAARTSDNTVQGIASVYNRMILAITSGHGVSQREVRGFMREGINLNEVLVDYTGKSGDVIAAMLSKTGRSAAENKKFLETVNAALIAYTTEGGRAANALAERSATFDGQMKIMTDRWNDTKRAFGTPVINALAPLLEHLGAKFSDTQSIAGGWGEVVAGAIRKIDEAVQSGRFGEILYEKAKAIGNALEPLLLAGFQRAGAAIGPILLAGLQLAFNNATQWAAGKVVTIGYALKEAGNTLNEARLAVEATAAGWGDSIAAAVSRMEELIRSGKLVEIMREKASQAIAAFQGIWQAGLNLWPILLAQLQSAFDNATAWAAGKVISIGVVLNKIGETISTKTVRGGAPDAGGLPAPDLPALGSDSFIGPNSVPDSFPEYSPPEIAIPSNPASIGGADSFAFGEPKGGGGGGGKSKADTNKIKTDIDLLATFNKQLGEINDTAMTTEARERMIRDAQAATIKQMADPASYAEALTANQSAADARLGIWRIEEEQRLRTFQLTEEQMKAGIASTGDVFQNSMQKLLDQWGSVQSQMGDAMVGIGNAITSNLTSAITDFATGAKSAGEAFKAMAVGMLKDIAGILIKLAIQIAMMQIVKALSGAAGGGEVGSSLSNVSGGAPFAGNAGSFAVPTAVPTYAPGGPIVRGTGTRDDVHILAQRGEFIQRKSAVQREGSAAMHALNRGDATIVPTYATGGATSGDMDRGWTPGRMAGSTGKTSANVNVEINNYGDKGSDGKETGEPTPDDARRLKEMIVGVVAQWNEDQKRWRGANNRHRNVV